jgi:hypothetical protein
VDVDMGKKLERFIKKEQTKEKASKHWDQKSHHICVFEIWNS